MSLMNDRRVAAAKADVDANTRAFASTLPLPAIDAPDFIFAANRARSAAEAMARALGVLAQHVQTVSAIRNGPGTRR